jgi:uncharacterized protein YijF (DUF1287 family)
VAKRWGRHPQTNSVQAGLIALGNDLRSEWKNYMKTWLLKPEANITHRQQNYRQVKV